MVLNVYQVSGNMQCPSWHQSGPSGDVESLLVPIVFCIGSTFYLVTLCDTERFYIYITTRMGFETCMFNALFVHNSLIVTMCVGKGDVCLLSESGACRGTGLVTYMQDQQKLGVCAESFGFLEAHVICSQHGLPKLGSVSHAP